MLTRMTDDDWAVVLEAFRAARSRRGDRKFLEAMHYFALHNVSWRALPAEFGDCPRFETLLDLGPDVAPRAAVADKGYDSKANRAAARSRGVAPVIPVKSNARNRPVFFRKALYRARARIEQCFGKLKRFERVALRCEKTAKSFAAIVALALGFILVKSVHTAQLTRLHKTSR